MVILFAKCEQKNTPKTIEKCHCSDLTYDETYNHYYQNKSTLPYTGKCMELNNHGALILTNNFIEGKMQGEMIRYQKNGNRASLLEYDKNLIHGSAIFYDINGKDSLVQQYQRGKLFTK